MHINVYILSKYMCLYFSQKEKKYIYNNPKPSQMQIFFFYKKKQCQQVQCPVSNVYLYKVSKKSQTCATGMASQG